MITPTKPFSTIKKLGGVFNSLDIKLSKRAGNAIYSMDSGAILFVKNRYVRRHPFTQITGVTDITGSCIHTVFEGQNGSLVFLHSVVGKENALDLKKSYSPGYFIEDGIRRVINIFKMENENIKSIYSIGAAYNPTEAGKENVEAFFRALKSNNLLDRLKGFYFGGERFIKIYYDLIDKFLYFSVNNKAPILMNNKIKENLWETRGRRIDRVS